MSGRIGNGAAPHSGVAAIAGRPNVGKSTLMNRLLGQKISIVSPKAQTTRQQVLGILSGDGFQVVFIDTPGVIEPRDRLQRMMVQAGFKAVSGADVVVLIVEATEPESRFDLDLVRRIEAIRAPRLLAINKIDLVEKEKLLPLIARYSECGLFKAIVPVSALDGDGLDDLLSELVKQLPRSDFLYSTEQIATQPMRFFAAELIRETIFEQLRQELPYATAVQIEQYSERPGDTAYIKAVIFVERKSQKGIIIGRGGEQLKKIGREARMKIEELAGSGVYLDLWVKVKDNWRKNESFLKMIGYTPEMS